MAKKRKGTRLTLDAVGAAVGAAVGGVRMFWGSIFLPPLIILMADVVGVVVRAIRLSARKQFIFIFLSSSSKNNEER